MPKPYLQIGWTAKKNAEVFCFFLLSQLPFDIPQTSSDPYECYKTQDRKSFFVPPKLVLLSSYLVNASSFAAVAEAPLVILPTFAFAAKSL